MEEYLSRKKEEEIIVQNWEKEKWKIKNLSKITILVEQDLSVQSAARTKAVQVWSWGKTVSISENEYWAPC